MKRGRKDQLTGGTGDVNLQTLGGRVTETAANTYTQAAIAVPVMRVGMTGNTAQVIEVLWVEFSCINGENFNAAGEEINLQLTQQSASGIRQLDDVDVIANYSWSMNLLTSGAAIRSDIVHIDLHDGAGHGMLIASPNIFFGALGVGLATAGTYAFRMGYRFKNVDLREYVGLAIQFGQT